jgi:Uncharacterized protein conserved in bacteria (DUF2188)
MTGKDKGNDTDRYVFPNRERGGYDVSKEDRKRVSAHTTTKAQAEKRAREIVDNLGGGVVREGGTEGKIKKVTTIRGPKQP